MPVAPAEHGQALCLGQVLVVPPGKHLLVTAQGRAALVASGVYPPNRPSADLLLISMALSLGSRAIAVVLSGYGHDGATGATAVHDFGGTVLAADEASSQQYAMPQATIARDNAVDESMDVERIAGRLQQLVSRPCAPG